MRRVTVVGGGAAGLMAALSGARAGAQVTLLERNEKLGKKLYITGKGRCNLTNAVSPEDFLPNVVTHPRFLYSALHALPPAALMELMESLGCPVQVQRGARVFPQSEKASDVTRALERELRRLGVEIRLNARVRSLTRREDAVTGVEMWDGQKLPADAVIVCTGGQSYPSTGSTGDGWSLLGECGHTLYPALPSLVPLICREPWVRALAGLSLKNVRLSVTQGQKKLFSDLGEMLFTHTGISGPLVLSASAYVTALEVEELDFRLDLKPGLDRKQLDRRVVRDIAQAPQRQLAGVLCGLYPARLAATVAQLCQLDARMPAGRLTQAQRARLVDMTAALPLPVTAVGPLEEAVVTHGGAEVRQFDPSTLQSRLVHGLYAAGELLDVDALTGGFNLHIAFATGFVAGRAAAQR